MSKFFKILFVILSVSLLMTACSDNNKKPGAASTTGAKNTTGTAESTPKNASTPAPLATQRPMLDNLFLTEHTLEIEKKGGNGFTDATEELTYVIADLFLKATEVDTNSPEGAKLLENYDFAKYDYKLLFSNTRNILVSVEDNLAHFEGDKTLYSFWGDTSKLWQSIKTNLDGKMELAESGYETLVKKYQHDITGNGQKTDIFLTYKASNQKDFKGDLILKIGNSQTTVSSSLLWQLRPKRTINDVPQIKFLAEKNKKNKVMIVYYSFIGNSYDQTGEAYAYSYNNGSINEVEFFAPEINFKYSGGDKYTAEFPQINSSQEVRFNSSSFSRQVNKNSTLEKVFSTKEGYYQHPYSFLIKDYNGDGTEELCSMSTPILESSGKMVVGTQYTFYYYESGKMKPFYTYITPPFYSKDDKATLAESDIMEMLFDHRSFTFGDKGVEDKWYKPSENYSTKELIDTVNSLLSKNVIKKNGNNIQFNF